MDAIIFYVYVIVLLLVLSVMYRKVFAVIIEALTRWNERRKVSKQLRHIAKINRTRNKLELLKGEQQ